MITGPIVKIYKLFIIVDANGRKVKRSLYPKKYRSKRTERRISRLPEHRDFVRGRDGLR